MKPSEAIQSGSALDKMFEKALESYPNAYVSDYQMCVVSDLFDEDLTEEMELPHTWQLVDAVAASFRTVERVGMLVLQEYRPGKEIPSNHWGYMIAKTTLQQKI